MMAFRFVAILFLPMIAEADPWVMRGGRTFDAKLEAADGLRATFTAEGRPPAVIPLEDLTVESREVVRKWRSDPSNPLVLPERLAAWPSVARIPSLNPTFKVTENGHFEYRSPHFLVRSDVKLPPYAAADILRVLEATRSAMIAVPLGFHAGGERGLYQIHMFGNAEGYGHAGGIRGSGGHYNARMDSTLILLPNFGIEQTVGGLRVDYAKNLFILRHEVAHHLLSRWHRHLPMWLNEGIAEFMASLPYSQGAYDLRNPTAGLRDYVLKWRPEKNDRRITLIPPSQLMPMTKRDWDDAVRGLSAYDLYQSAALLTGFLIQKDGGKPIASCLELLRKGKRANEILTIVRGGKPAETLDREVVGFCTKLGLETGL